MRTLAIPAATAIAVLAAGCGSGAHPAATRTPATVPTATASANPTVPDAAASASAAAAAAARGCQQFAAVNSQISSAIPPGTTGTATGPAGDISLAALQVSDTVLDVQQGRDSAVPGDWALASAALAKAAKDCAR